jgi:hypothetical protein
MTDERFIDAYKVQNGDYVFSFSIPKHNDKRAKALTMTEEFIWVLYDNEIVQYSYHLP